MNRLLAVVLLSGSVHITSAQVQGFGFVQGNAVDDKGAPLPNVMFTAT